VKLHLSRIRSGSRIGLVTELRLLDEYLAGLVFTLSRSPLDANRLLEALSMLGAFGHAQAIDRFCNDIRISRVVLRYGQRWSVKAFDEAMYAGFRESVEHEAIFGDCGGSRRVSHLVEVRIFRAPADRFELVAGQ